MVHFLPPVIYTTRGRALYSFGFLGPTEYSTLSCHPTYSLMSTSSSMTRCPCPTRSLISSGSLLMLWWCLSSQNLGVCHKPKVTYHTSWERLETMIQIHQIIEACCCQNSETVQCKLLWQTFSSPLFAHVSVFDCHPPWGHSWGQCRSPWAGRLGLRGSQDSLLDGWKSKSPRAPLAKQSKIYEKIIQPNRSPNAQQDIKQAWQQCSGLSH